MRSRGIYVVCLSACLAGCEWTERRAFEEQLRCGMTPAEVQTIAEDYGADAFHAADEVTGRTTHAVTMRRSFVHFGFGEQGLVTVQGGETKGWTAVDMEPLLNLCTGERTSRIHVDLVATPELAGASVYVDDEKQLAISAQGHRTVTVLNGPHEITIKKEGYEEIRIPVDYSIDSERDEIRVPDPVPLGGG